jgi:hypothetical protein
MPTWITTRGNYRVVLTPLLSGTTDVQRVFHFWHAVGNRFLTLLSNMATNLNLSDMETCDKVLRREVVQQLEIEEDRLGFEPEITTKVRKLNVRIDDNLLR